MSAAVSTNPAATDIDDAASVCASIAFEVWWDTLPQLQQEMMAAHARACFVAGFNSGSRRLEAAQAPAGDGWELVDTLDRIVCFPRGQDVALPSTVCRFGFDAIQLSPQAERHAVGEVSIALEVSDSARPNTGSEIMDAILKHLSREFDDIRAQGAFA